LTSFRHTSTNIAYHLDSDSQADENRTENICSLVETIQKMQEREDSYKVTDYLHRAELSPQCPEPVDIPCRVQMIDWMKNIIDYCKFSRSSIFIAVNCLDRFVMASDWVLMDRSAFQLAAITCLYMAIKITEPTVLSVATIAKLTRDAYEQDQFVAMERVILQSIKWLVNPSTAMTYAPYLCELARTLDSRLHVETLQELVKLQLENSLGDYEMGLLPASAVCLAAVINGMDVMGSTSIQQQRAMASELKSYMNLDTGIRMHEVQVRLHKGIGVAESMPRNTAGKLRRVVGVATHSGHSPRAVSDVRVL